MKRIQPIGWVIFAAIALAGALVFVILNSDFNERVQARLNGYSRRTDYQETLHASYRRQSATVPPGALVMLGDSMLHGIAACALDSNAVNFSVGGDTSYGALRRAKDYACLQAARLVLLHVGVNDCAGGKSADMVVENVRKIIASVSPAPVVISAALPVRDRRAEWLNASIRELNGKLRSIQGARFIDASGAVSTDGRLNEAFDDGDGQHLNGKGSAAWAAELRRLLDTR